MPDEVRLLVFTELDDSLFPRLFSVYRESSMENAAAWYPELPEAEALEKYESGFRDYLLGPFQTEHGMLLVLEKKNMFLSALRLYPQEHNSFFLEALETHPDYREMGYGKRILQEMMLYLHQSIPGCSVCSHVSKKNKISICTHRAAGFSLGEDYVVEDGVRDDARLCMIWNDTQLSRIESQEARLNRVLSAKRPSLEDLRALAEYYESPFWRLDFESDEAGQIPEQIKRGVLSEDAIYNVLSDYEDMLRK